MRPCIQREVCGYSHGRPGIAISQRRLGVCDVNLSRAGICGVLCREAEAQPGKKDGARRTEPQQDLGVSSPMLDGTQVREIGKIDE